MFVYARIYFRWPNFYSIWRKYFVTCVPVYTECFCKCFHTHRILNQMLATFDVWFGWSRNKLKLNGMQNVDQPKHFIVFRSFFQKNEWKDTSKKKNNLNRCSNNSWNFNLNFLNAYESRKSCNLYCVVPLTSFNP